MGSRDRDTKSFHDKLKVFFKKGASAPVAAQSELVVTAELRRELSPETPLSRRLRAIKEISDRVLHIRVHEGGVENIWSCTRDLLEDPNIETRHAALSLFRNIAEGQTELLVMRTVLFRFLRETHAGHPPDDYILRFKLLYALTNTGKDIKCFEEEIGPFLLEWLPQIQAPAHIIEFFNLVINVVKFNAVYLDEEIVHGIVNNACHLCVYSSEGGVVQGCLTLLQAVVSYSLLPRPALPTFVAALCRTVNIEHYCQNSWKLMRNVVGADMGHAALQEMVELVRGAARGRDAAGLARGAVFYINMALWGPRRVHTLHVSFLAVLPAFLKALDGGHAVVTYEVVMALQSLVARVHEQLHAVSWDLVLDIVRGVLEQDKTFDPPNELIHSRVHALISSMEVLHEAGQFHGDAEALLDLIDLCGHDRPESSTMRLISTRCGALSGAAAGAALALAERYVRSEPRPVVRLHALACLVAYIKRHRCSHGEELSERVGGSLAAACALDADVSLRAAAARALPDLARMCSPDACIDLIDQLEKILNRPFDMYVSEVSIPREADTSELQAAAGALLELLHDKLLRAPAAPAARAFLVLLDHLDHHYRRPALLHHHPEIRLKIFDMLFALRANEFNCVGFCYDDKGYPVSGAGALRLRARCSALLLVEPPAPRAAPPPPPRELPPGAVLLPAGRLARALPAALAREPDWAVLAHVLRALPPLLHARALALGRRAQDLDLLAATLCSMVSDRSLCLAGGPGSGKLLVSDFHAAALPSLAALASYHAYLEPQTQQRIVKCLLKYGMVLRSPQPYINALTMFTLETRDTMVKLLPEVLLDLSKISDTKAIASPMLEFLSTLTRLPRVYASFVEDQCMTVFAILLPYTNPSRYNHYVVSLAHHVIAAWFLKCRLAYRRNFVSFIINGLHNYIIVPFEEQYAHRATHQRSNEDSSNRQRSSSLGSRAVSHAPLSGSRGGGAGRDSSSLATFHVELTETCIDLLARYTFTPCSVKPQRSDTAEFLFNGGQSTTWLVGHKLVTITTSGCLQNSIKQGLCERCAALCRQHAESASSALPGDSQVPTAHAPEPIAHAQVPTAHAQIPTSHAQAQVPTAHAKIPDSSEQFGSMQPPPAEVKRQNSAENKTTDPLLDALNQFTQRFEKVSKEVECEEGGRSRAGELAAAGACPCWCARWAELHVRSPTGDVSWLLRMQNHISSSQLQEWPLQDVLALLAPPGLGAAAAPARPDPPDGSLRAAPPAAAQRGPTQDLHKSSSDSVVGDRRGRTSGARLGTQPINIPGSPQRQSSSSTTDDEDMLLTRPEGKSRHHVRRSNSSPEMSSLKGLTAREPDFELPPDQQQDRDHDHHSHILLPICEPISGPMTLHVSKKANKKNDTRVSCEAIPEEMSGTSPQPHTHTTAPDDTHTHAHPHLMTYNSDPGAAGGVAADERAPALPLQKTSSDSRVTPGLGATLEPRAGGDAEARAAGASSLRDELQPLSRSKRSNTISVMSPTRRNRELNRSGAGAPSAGGGSGSGAVGGGVSPSFVFLQLYHNMSTFPISPCVPGDPSSTSAGAAAGAGAGAAARPLKVSEAQHQRTIKNLDLVPPLETYKVGVLYVGPGQQDDEVAILKNEYGSVRYMEFLRQLGTLVPLEGADPNLFLNLERGGKDGRYTYVWSDDIMQVLFHVATAMPSSDRDPTCNEKRKYIGNDFVSIVYNDSQHNFNIHTIKGQFNLCIVVVEPLAHGMHRVTLKTKDERLRTEFLAHAEPACVSDHNVALLARQHALHTALASQISQSLKPGREPYASNSLERLRLIKRLRSRALAARLARPAPPYAPGPAPLAIDDFNHYT